MADFRVENHGSIVIVQPLTAEATTWLAEHISSDAQWWAGGVVVEPRYVEDLVVGMAEDGLKGE